MDADGRVIASQHDRVVGERNLTSHAELLAVRAAGAAAAAGTLVSTVEPCVMCFAAAWTARLAGVAFGLSMVELRAARPESMDEIVIDVAGLNTRAERRLTIIAGVLHGECAALWDLG